MFKVLGIFVLFIIIAVAILIFGIIGWILRVVRGGSTSSRQNNAGGDYYRDQSADEDDRQKQFSKNEGEYVDFEEIKEDKN